MFGVLMITLLLTIALVGSNMDVILKQGIVYQVRAEITENPAIAESFSTVEEFDKFIQDQIDQRIETLGLDEPWYSPQRVGFTMYKILILDFGNATFLTSDSGSSNVGDILLEKIPRTVLLFTTATIIISIIGIFLGALAGSKVGSAIDRITSAFAVISSSFPVWWIGMLMIFLFAFTYHIFPARATPSILPTEPGYILALLYHMALPLITIVMIGFGAWAYLVRNFMVGTMQEDFIIAKKSVGIDKKNIIYKHALKNAAPPIITILALSLSGSLGGAIITEAVFDWPGMGRLYFEAISVMDLPIIGDVAEVITSTIKTIKKVKPNFAKSNKQKISKWWEKIEKWRSIKSFDFINSTELIKPQYAIQRLYELTKNKETYITTEVGQHQMWAAQHYKFNKPNHWMTSGGLGTMGYGLPAAVGVQVANPNKLVIDIAGEASVLMTMQEMSTAVQYNLPIKIFILNNEYMGMVRQWQELLHEKNYSESYTAALPDFVKLAEAYGCVGIRANKPDELDEKIEQMLSVNKPVIFDCVVDKTENCYPMIPSGKPHNQMLLGKQDEEDEISEEGKVLV